MSFCVKFVGNLIEGMEVKHHVARGLETSLPPMDQEEQGQVEKLLAQCSSAQSLSPCGDSLNVITLEKHICVDRFVIDGLCKKWSTLIIRNYIENRFKP